MGVYIKNMEMPTSCVNCRFSGFGGLRNERIVCMHTGSNAYMNAVQYLDDCPLVPVPPHGDLIDRGYAIATACSGRIRALPTTEDGEDWIRVEEVRESIKNAPTIIPAEEGGE